MNSLKKYINDSYTTKPLISIEDLSHDFRLTKISHNEYLKIIGLYPYTNHRNVLKKFFRKGTYVPSPSGTGVCPPFRLRATL